MPETGLGNQFRMASARGAKSATCGGVVAVGGLATGLLADLRYAVLIPLHMLTVLGRRLSEAMPGRGEPPCPLTMPAH